MRIFLHIMLFIVIALSTSACSIRHYIANDYPQYLAKNSGVGNLSKTDKASEYFLTPETQHHSYEFRAVVTGYANLWIVEFGKILEETLDSSYVQSAFGSLQKVSKKSGSSKGLLTFDLKDYKFKDFGAQITLKVTLSRSGQEVFSKTYMQEGKTQGGKMFWGGAFAQRNAVQQSTKLALDEILRQVISDLNTQTI